MLFRSHTLVYSLFRSIPHTIAFHSSRPHSAGTAGNLLVMQEVPSFHHADTLIAWRGPKVAACLPAPPPPLPHSHTTTLITLLHTSWLSLYANLLIDFYPNYIADKIFPQLPLPSNGCYKSMGESGARAITSVKMCNLQGFPWKFGEDSCCINCPLSFFNSQRTATLLRGLHNLQRVCVCVSVCVCE